MAKLILTKPNLLINSNFDFWQRGLVSNAAGNNLLVADRWVCYNNGTNTMNISRQDISALGIGSQYCLRAERSTGTDLWFTESNLETSHLQALRGKTATFSILIRKGSAFTSNMEISLQTTTTEARGSAAIETASLAIPNASLSTSTFARFSVSLAIPAGTSAAGLRVRVRADGQAGAVNAYFEIAQAMLNEGRSPVPYSYAGGNRAGELIECLRYFEKSYSIDVAPGAITNVGVWQWFGNAVGNRPYTTVPFKVLKRSTPVLNLYNPRTASTSTPIWESNQPTTDFNAQTQTEANQIRVTVNGSSMPTDALPIFHWVVDAEL